MAAPLVDREIWCTCGSVMYATTTRKTENGREFTYRYYGRHATKGYDRTPTCSAPRIRAEVLEDAVFSELLGFAGNAELVEKRMIPGKTYAEDIARMKDRLSHLNDQIEQAEALGGDVTDLTAKRDRARAEYRRLLNLEPVPDRIEPVRTGKKFSAYWESLSTAQKNEFLRSAGITVTAHRQGCPRSTSCLGP
ncbi:MAG TPA: recombinase zinc beta ribbon domain-containing protein [Trebonia sp.]|jgi:hypothetical protein